MDYVHFASFETESDSASNRASNPCRYSSAVVEQLTCNQQVPSSTLGGGTTLSFFSFILCFARFHTALGRFFRSHRPDPVLCKAQAPRCAGQKVMSVQFLLGYTQSTSFGEIHRQSST